jgi:hypothetical protein
VPQLDRRPIIIGGSHRSGTSLLRRLLNGHSRIFCPPEIKFYKDLLQQFPSDPLRHGRLAASMSALGLAEHVWLDEFGKALVRCYELAAAGQGKPRWADKSPENALNIRHWDRLLGGELHFLMVLRHPLDIIASMAETPMPLVIPATPEGRARHVADYVAAGLGYCEAHRDRSSVVRYESLVTDPERALRDLLDRIGERFEPAMLAEPGAARHGAGLEDPKVKVRNRVSADSIGRWRRDLSPEHQQLLQRELAGLLRRLEY